ncbi:MAG: ribonuclease R [Bdellovibrionales bacterium CG10_big_fil_rev_8_21_14_0_10_45_34]|nr:MAG: ribonuclease R [Bdellovibrionales bacterium CG10_big_fil_rev_8_21_14_0_10_45_34]
MSKSKSIKNNKPKVHTKQPQLLEGIIKRHQDGFGFFVPDDREHPDVYIPRHSMGHVMTTDQVKIRAFKQGDGRYNGEIVEILSRSITEVLGQFHSRPDGSGRIYDNESTWGQSLYISADNTKNAKDSELVRVRITTYPSDTERLTGNVIEVLGSAQDPLLDAKRCLFQHGIPNEFSEGAIAESRHLKRDPDLSEVPNRKDLRKTCLITIDGATAKDFDDAIYVEQTAKGFRLIVAIADVSHYVKDGSAIDKDAYKRGTSTYFPRFVAPMLPEVLSNELCSLKPNVPRLAFAADMLFDFRGERTSETFYECVIESKARLTYGIAQEIVDGEFDVGALQTRSPNGASDRVASSDRTGAQTSANELEKNLRDQLNPEVINCVLRANDLAKLLLAKRMASGSLDLDIPETEILLDDSGTPIDMIRSERLFAHRLIEEMMLAANVAVAEYFSKKEVPSLYRIHDEPAADSLEMLNSFLDTFGAKKKVAGGSLQKKLTQALQQFEATPQHEILSILTLRSMKQAQYSSDNRGHFGLGFSDYLHFTSPIRRYPDLIVHRLLKQALKDSDQNWDKVSEYLESAGPLLSASEQRSVKAERLFKSIKKARYMSMHLGEEYEGFISSVTKFGVFVLLRSVDIDGLVRAEDLGSESFEFDEQTLSLVGKRSRKTYSLGDPLKIIVSKADVDTGQVDFVLADSSFGGGARQSVSHKDKRDTANHAKKHRSTKSDRDKKARSSGNRNQGDRNQSDRSQSDRDGDQNDRSQSARNQGKRYREKLKDSKPNDKPLTEAERRAEILRKLDQPKKAKSGNIHRGKTTRSDDKGSRKTPKNRRRVR